MRQSNIMVFQPWSFLYRFFQLLLIVYAIGYTQGAWAEGTVTPKAVDERVALRTQLAAAYSRVGNYAVAIEEAEKVLAISPGYAPAYNVLAFSYLQQGDEKKAHTYFTKALSLSPHDPESLHNYGWFLCERGDEANGLKKLQAALEVPRYLNLDATLVAAGDCAAKANKNELAIGYYEHAIKFRPSNVQARLQLALLFFKTGKLPEARAILQKALLLFDKGEPPPANLLWLAVRIEHKLNNTESEKKFAHELRKKYPTSLETSRLIAKQYD